jgi:hypothetical protein
VRALRPTAISTRLLAGLAIALVAGIAIGYMDSRPGWDDTGITAVLLLIAAGVASAVAGRAPWVVAIAAGIWVPLFELPGLASGGSLLALVFSSVGAAIGWLIGRR